MEQDNTDIYKMKLHEVIEHIEPNINSSLGTCVTRVPGGWVYSFFDKSSSVGSSVFVAYNNEYQREDQSIGNGLGRKALKNKDYTRVSNRKKGELC